MDFSGILAGFLGGNTQLAHVIVVVVSIVVGLNLGILALAGFMQKLAEALESFMNQTQTDLDNKADSFLRSAAAKLAAVSGFLGKYLPILVAALPKKPDPAAQPAPVAKDPANG